MNARLAGSVGRGGVNDAVEVKIVQARLNQLMDGKRRRLVVDGKCGRHTVAALISFQRIVGGLKSPDGRVDPGGRTQRVLNDPGSAGKWSMSTKPARQSAGPRRAVHNSTAVEEVGYGDLTAAWLFGFAVDSHELNTGHKDWLDRRVVLPVDLIDISLTQGEQVGGEAGDLMKIWVVGATSRTAAMSHNADLSMRRAEAVRAYLLAAMSDSMVPLAIDVYGWGELPAAIKGRRDDVENAFDRGVAVIMRSQPADIPQPPPEIRPPRSQTGLVIPCCYALAYGALALAAKDSWAYSGYGGGPRAAGMRGYDPSGGMNDLRYAQERPDEHVSIAILMGFGFSRKQANELYSSNNGWFNVTVGQYGRLLGPRIADGIAAAKRMLVGCLDDPKHPACSDTKRWTACFGQPLAERHKKEILRRLDSLSGVSRGSGFGSRNPGHREH
jgi:hypothetical protein